MSYADIFVTIKDWMVVDRYANDPYKAPELRGIALRGKVYGHPDFEDGLEVVTGVIQKTEGTWVKTGSTTYVVTGPPIQSYQDWCDENGYTIDPKNPVKVRSTVG